MEKVRAAVVKYGSGPATKEQEDKTPVDAARRGVIKSYPSVSCSGFFHKNFLHDDGNDR